MKERKPVRNGHAGTKNSTAGFLWPFLTFRKKTMTGFIRKRKGK